jgi:caa(3)-type oxidase subunit IV
MTTAQATHCSNCGHANPSGALFCNSCGKTIEPPKPPTQAPLGVPPRPAVVEAEHDQTHHPQMFYFWVFLVLTVITIVEVFLTNIDNTAIRITSLMVLSTAKFALVIMFFMHLSGDNKMYKLLFVGPVLLGGAVLVSLVGLFQNF